MEIAPQFFVYVVESPSDTDFYHRRNEGDALVQSLRLNGIDCVVRCAISHEAFSAALQIGLKEEIAAHASRLPLLHISCHGNAHGIRLSSGERVTWDELSSLLHPINLDLNNRLVVAMSSCEGYSGIRMAMKTDDSPLPFFALIGSWENPTWSDTVVAFSAFYHHLQKGRHVRQAVEAMSAASGCRFAVEWAEDQKDSYRNFLKTYNPTEAVCALESGKRQQPETIKSCDRSEAMIIAPIAVFDEAA